MEIDETSRAINNRISSLEDEIAQLNSKNNILKNERDTRDKMMNELNDKNRQLMLAFEDKHNEAKYLFESNQNTLEKNNILLSKSLDVICKLVDKIPREEDC